MSATFTSDTLAAVQSLFRLSVPVRAFWHFPVTWQYASITVVHKNNVTVNCSVLDVAVHGVFGFACKNYYWQASVDLWRRWNGFELTSWMSTSLSWKFENHVISISSKASIRLYFIKLLKLCWKFVGFDNCCISKNCSETRAKNAKKAFRVNRCTKLHIRRWIIGRNASCSTELPAVGEQIESEDQLLLGQLVQCTKGVGKFLGLARRYLDFAAGKNEGRHVVRCVRVILPNFSAKSLEQEQK